MGDVAGSKLRQVMARHGPDLFTNPRIAEVLRESLGPELKLQASVLNAAVQLGLPQRLRLLQPGPVTSVALRNTASTMAEATGFKEELTLWAATTWAEALGVTVVQLAPGDGKFLSGQPGEGEGRDARRAKPSALLNKSLIFAAAVLLLVGGGALVSSLHWGSSTKTSAPPLPPQPRNPATPSVRPATQPERSAPEPSTGCFVARSKYYDWLTNRTVVLIRSTDPYFSAKAESAKREIIREGGTISSEHEFAPDSGQDRDAEFPYFWKTITDRRPAEIVLCGTKNDTLNFGLYTPASWFDLEPFRAWH